MIGVGGEGRKTSMGCGKRGRGACDEHGMCWEWEGDERV